MVWEGMYRESKGRLKAGKPGGIRRGTEGWMEDRGMEEGGRNEGERFRREVEKVE